MRTVLAERHEFESCHRCTGDSCVQDTLAHLHGGTDGDSVYIQPITTRVSQIQGETTAGQSDSGKTEATGVAVILAAGCVAFGVLSTPVLALAVCRLSHTMQLGGGTEYPPAPEQKTTPLVSPTAYGTNSQVLDCGGSASGGNFTRCN